MKRRWLIIGAAIILIATAAFAFAQYSGFNLPWISIDGGGNRSQAGAFELFGTIGQPDAGAVSGDGFFLNGGFVKENPLREQPSIFLPVIIK